VTGDKAFDESLDEALLDEDAALDSIAVVAEGLPTVAAPAGLLARVMDSARSEPRFARYVASVARLVDVSAEQASEMLSRLGEAAVWEPGFVPGIELFHVKGGPRVAHAITGFVRMREHVTFPEHEHFGPEAVLILQGRCEEQGQIFGPGDEVSMEAGTQHTFTVCAGPDLVYLAVVHQGLRIGDMTLSADDPRA
jgi:hypothetical protein